MAWMKRWMRRLAYWLGRAREERELDEEMRFHMDMEARCLVEEGVAPGEARRRAAVAFGGVDRYREQVRDARGVGWLDDLGRDVGFALRTLRRSPAFTLFGLLVLALGIGATTAVFSVVQGVLLRPLPYPAPQQLVRVWQAIPARGALRTTFSVPDLRDFSQRSTTLSHVAGYTTLPGALVLTGDGPAEEIPTAYVAGDFFGVMGTAAFMGRTLTPDEYGGQDRVVVLSHDYWRRRFGGNPGVVGSTLTLDRQAFQVVGIMPPGFDAPAPGVDAWAFLSVVPQDAIPHELRFVRFLQAVGRLAPGTDPRQAEQELSAVASSLARSLPETNGDRTAATVVPLHEVLVGDVRTTLWVMLGAVGLLLLMACATVAGLLLARGNERRGELAIRMSLGAGRGRVVRQLLTESATLGLAGGAGGLALAWVGTSLLARSGTDLLPRSAEVGLDPWVLAVAGLATLVTTTVFGLLPARRVAADGLEATLRDAGGSRGGTGSRSLRLRRSLVAGEVAVAVMLSVGAVLLARSLVTLHRVDLGFQPEGAVAMDLTIAQEKYPTRADYMGLYRTILERAAALPGVEAVGSLRRLPTRGAGETQPFSVPGLYEPGADDEPNLEVIHVGGAAFQALGTPVLAGRTFDERDGPESPLRLVVNRTFVETYLQGAEPVGRPVSFGEVPAEIIGVVGDIRHGAPDVAPEPVAYVHQEQNARIGMAFIVRLSEGTDPGRVLADLRALVAALDPDQPITELLPLETALADALARPRAVTSILAAFAAMAALLAALGVYGVMASMVRARLRELGLRMALGARAEDVVGMIIRQGMLSAALGLVAGATGAALLARLLESLLYGVPALDPASFALAVAGLAILCAVACLVPALRASRLHPMDVLRTE